MDSLIVVITLLFLAVRVAYGIGARHHEAARIDVINAMAKTIASLGGLIFLLLIISQFLAYFNYTNMATLAAVKLADLLESANLGALLLLIGFVIVVVAPRSDHHRRDPEMGHLRAHLRAAADAAERRRRKRCWRPTGSATRR